MKYKYYKVLPQNRDTAYDYLSQFDHKIGVHVQIPFGPSDRAIFGTIIAINEYAEDTVPFPVEKMKYIICEVPEEKFKTGGLDDIDGPFVAIDSYIEAEDYDEIFRWACDHMDDTDPLILDKVVMCFELCYEQSNPVAALNLGTMYYNGRGVEQDYQKAAALYEIAAKAGERLALCNLAYCFYYGRHQEVDYGEAYRYFSYCAILYDDSNSLYKLGDMYMTGKHVEKNPDYAVKLYFRAHDAIMKEGEDQYCLPDILLRIGKLFLKGEYIKQDSEIALKLFMDALNGFYSRRKTDPFVRPLIAQTKSLIAEAAANLDKEL